jgi:hypothetical protein
LIILASVINRLTFARVSERRATERFLRDVASPHALYDKVHEVVTWLAHRGYVTIVYGARDLVELTVQHTFWTRHFNFHLVLCRHRQHIKAYISQCRHWGIYTNILSIREIRIWVCLPF